MHEKYVSQYNEERHFDLYNLEFKIFVKYRLYEPEQPALINEWTSNMDEAAYKKQEKENTKNEKKTNISLI